MSIRFDPNLIDWDLLWYEDSYYKVVRCKNFKTAIEAAEVLINDKQRKIRRIHLMPALIVEHTEVFEHIDDDFNKLCFYCHRPTTKQCCEKHPYFVCLECFMKTHPEIWK